MNSSTSTVLWNDFKNGVGIATISYPAPYRFLQLLAPNSTPPGIP